MVVDSPPWLLLSGVAAAPAFLLTWYWRTVHKQAEIQKGLADVEKGQADLKLAVDSQLTQRFVEAIELLGHENAEVRLGGIYALERLAADSERDHWTIIETLAAFVRGLSRDRSDESPAPAEIQAALTVIGRRQKREETGVINLSGAQLSGVRLTGNFAMAEMIGCRLRGAIIWKVNFDRAQLLSAYLRDAIITDVSLADAVMVKSDLSGTSMVDVNFCGADMRYVKFKDLYVHKLGSLNISNITAEADLEEYLKRANAGDLRSEGAT
jgi:hypothetical protein